jgi:hypothetical protein
MDKAQSHQTEAPAAPQEERAARHLRLLARAAEIQMEVMEATRTEAVETPQPGVDYCRADRRPHQVAAPDPAAGGQVLPPARGAAPEGRPGRSG